MRTIRFLIGFLVLRQLWLRAVEAEQRAAEAVFASSGNAGEENDAHTRRIRDASAVLTGIAFGIGATFAASAIVMQGTASPDEFWAVAWGAFGFGALAWSNLGSGPRRRYIAFATVAFAMMTLAILASLGVIPFS